MIPSCFAQHDSNNVSHGTGPRHHSGHLPSSDARRWLAVASLCSATLLAVMDNTIVNVAIPTMGTALHATSSDLQWVVDAYTLSLTVMLLPFGKLGGHFGRRRLLMIGLIGFAACSACAAASGALGVLIALRVALGVCAAMIYPATLSLITDVFADSSGKGLAVGLWAATSGVGIALGPVIGGVVLAHAEWHAVFWVCAGMALAALTATALFVPEPGARMARRPHRTHHNAKGPLHVTTGRAPFRRCGFDIAGTLLSAAGVGSLVWAIIEEPRHGWASWWTVGGLCAAVLLIAWFICHERRAEHPLTDLTLFSEPAFGASAVAIGVAFFCLFGFTYLCTQWFQTVRGYSALGTAIATLPFAVVMAFVSPIASMAAARLTARIVVPSGLLMVAASFAVVGLVDAQCGYWTVVVPTMALMAAGIACIQSPATSALMNTVSVNRSGEASAINDMIREIGGVLGVAVMGSAAASAFSAGIIARWTDDGLPASALSTGRTSIMAAHEIARHLAEPVRSAILAQADVVFMGALHHACRLAATVALVMAVIYAIAVRGTRRTDRKDTAQPADV